MVSEFKGAPCSLVRFVPPLEPMNRFDLPAREGPCGRAKITLNGGVTMSLNDERQRRILTTHVGSLPRSDGLSEMMARANRSPAYARCVREAVADVVKRQADCGIDIVDDGEQSKPGFITTSMSGSAAWRRAPAIRRGKSAAYLRNHWAAHPCDAGAALRQAARSVRPRYRRTRQPNRRGLFGGTGAWPDTRDCPSDPTSNASPERI